MNSFLILLKTISTFFTNFPKIFFSKDFVKKRRHLHFICTIPIILVCFLFAYKYMHLKDLPMLFIIFLGWFGGYSINWLREGYYNYKSKYKIPFDYLDVHAGAYGGITASIIYLIII